MKASDEAIPAKWWKLVRQERATNLELRYSEQIEHCREEGEEVLVHRNFDDRPAGGRRGRPCPSVLRPEHSRRVGGLSPADVPYRPRISAALPPPYAASNQFALED